MMGAPSKKTRNAFDVQRRRGHDHLQIRASRQQALEHAHQQIDVQGAFMRLIDDDGVVAAQQRVGGQLRQQQTVGHQHQPRDLGNLIGEPDAKTDAASHRLTDFLGNACGQGARGQTPRLGMRDQRIEAASGLQTILGQLRALARARVAGDDQYLMRPQCLDNGVALRRDRQIGVVLEHELGRAACGGAGSLLTRHALLLAKASLAHRG
jgi:hypothetical protein